MNDPLPEILCKYCGTRSVTRQACVALRSTDTKILYGSNLQYSRNSPFGDSGSCDEPDCTTKMILDTATAANKDLEFLAPFGKK